VFIFIFKYLVIFKNRNKYLLQGTITIKRLFNRFMMEFIKFYNLFNIGAFKKIVVFLLRIYKVNDKAN